MMSHHTKKEFTTIIWDSFSKQAKKFEEENSFQTLHQQIVYGRLLSLINILVLARKGLRIQGD